MSSPLLTYSRIPRINCKRKCQAFCGIVMVPQAMSAREFKIITNHLGHEPVQSYTDCPMLDPSGSCSIYNIRPAICRVWGTVKALACPHGCLPDRWLSDKEAREIFEELEKL